jgi:uncharacterized RDD family membrane protein YckC
MTDAFGCNVLVDILWFFVVFSRIYFASVESSAWQATLGKRVPLLRDGPERLSFWRVSLCFAGGCSAPCRFSAVFAGFTQFKQALHDMMASSLVTRSDGL